MTVANLIDVLTPALDEGYGVAGLVVLGWEDACAFVAAAEELGALSFCRQDRDAGHIHLYPFWDLCSVRSQNRHRCL